MSPIRTLDGLLEGALVRIAPEKEDQLQIKYDFFGFNFYVIDKAKFSVEANTSSKEVTVTTSTLEFLWCASFAFHVFYQEYCNANNGTSHQFNINGNERSSKALQLYQWGLDQLKPATNKKWPENLPKPELDPKSDDVAVANELYLCAAAWIMHHEIAHIYLGHPNNPDSYQDSRQQEKQADEAATKWVLNANCNQEVLSKRGLGVVVANLVITSQDIFAGKFKESTHPRSFKRLYDAITPYFAEDDHLVYAFSTVIFHINMTLGGMEIIKDDNQTWRENLETCLAKFESHTEYYDC